MREARRRCVESGRAVLVEAMTYRIGWVHRHDPRDKYTHRSNICRDRHHSTSDDSFAYRARSEVENWVKSDNPLSRFRLFLEARGWWSSEEEEAMKSRLRIDVLKSLKRAESKKRHELQELFEDVYAGPEPWNIVRSFLLVALWMFAEFCH